MKEIIITEQMRQEAHFDPETGLFSGNISWHLRKDGYISVSYRGTSFLAHRLAYAWVHGELSKDVFIDHRDGVRHANWIGNLRPASARQNAQNMAHHRDGNKAGACFHKAAGRWQAGAVWEGRRYGLGLFNTEQEAHEAYNTFLACPDKEEYLRKLRLKFLYSAQGYNRNRHNGKYYARIRIGKVGKSLGGYFTIEEARTAYLTACDKYHGANFMEKGAPE